MSNVDPDLRKAERLLAMRKETTTVAQSVSVERALSKVPPLVRQKAERNLLAGPEPEAETPTRGRSGAVSSGPGGRKTNNQLAYEQLKTKVADANNLKAYAITGLDSASRRKETLTQMENLATELGKWEWLDEVPEEMHAAASEAKAGLQPQIAALTTIKQRMTEIAAGIPEIPSDPGFTADEKSDAAMALTKRILGMDRDLMGANDEINAAKTDIGQVWQTITATTKTSVKAIETAVKEAVVRMHDGDIDTIQAVQTVAGRVLGILGLLDVTFVGELGMKGLAVGIEAAGEAAKRGAEIYKAGKMGMDAAFADYDEWDIPMASAERWKGAIKVAVHAAIIPIPKSDLLSPFIDGAIEIYFDAAIKDGKALQEKQKAGAAVEEGPEAWWNSLKDNLVEEFVPEKLSEGANTWLGAMSSVMGKDGEGAKGIGIEILAKLSKAIVSTLREKLLPVEPAEPVPALDIKARLGDLSSVYTKALKREMDPDLKSEFEQALKAGAA